MTTCRIRWMAFVILLSAAGLARSEAVDIRISSGTDDAEEKEDASGVYLTSTDLELVQDEGTGAGSQKIGLRFNGAAIPKGAKISKAHVQFCCDEPTVDASDLTIKGEAADNPATFGENGGNISTRSVTAASAAWSPAAWDVEHRADAAERTPDLSAIVQEIVSRPGWAPGNSLVLIITGTGVRTAESFEGGHNEAALLHVEWEGGAAQAAQPAAPAPQPAAAAPAPQPAAAVPAEQPAAPAPAPEVKKTEAPAEDEDVEEAPPWTDKLPFRPIIFFLALVAFLTVIYFLFKGTKKDTDKKIEGPKLK